MVCSAPEMTTVSKPNRNPASAELMDQKKMRAFMGRLWPALRACGAHARGCRAVVMQQGKNTAPNIERTDLTRTPETSYDRSPTCQACRKAQNIGTSRASCAPTSRRPLRGGGATAKRTAVG